MARKDDIKDRRIGLLVSIGTHALLLLLFIFIMAWREPNPPHPEYGIEINLGFEQEGSGFVQPESTPAPVNEEAAPTEAEEQVEEEVEEEIPQVEEIVEETQAPEQTEELEDSQQEDSPVETVPEAKAPVTEQPIEEAPVETAPEKEQVVEQEPSKPQVKEEVVDERSLFPNAGNQGRSDGQVGDAGAADGSVDARALYGKHGGGDGGPQLDIAGWNWDYIPRPDDTSNESGRIIFEIKVDDRGDVIAVRTLEKTVSSQVEQIYRREVERLTFSPTSDNTIPASISVGKITFIIRSK